uniref:RIIa domain-containing protein n=1 Tax=Cryptomonas curvata TaxID=233186 RepID=A0A7S0QER5_9CRYP
MYCAEQINIPENLGEILKAYAKEVIRQQPDNVFEFSARYFAQLDQNEEGMEQGDETLVSQDALIGIVAECMDKGGATRGAEEVEVQRMVELCEQHGISPSAVEQALMVLLPATPDAGGPAPINWRRLVVALCAQVVGVEDVKGFVRLLLDPTMFGDDNGRIAKTEFIQLFNWWSSVDPGITAEAKAGLFAALASSEVEIMTYQDFLDAFKEAA